MTTRRGFLQTIGFAAAAPSVAGKEAAKAMGLVGPIGSATIGAAGACPPDMPYPTPAYKAASHGEWLRGQLTRLWSPEAAASRRESYKHQARILDSDIASMRALSPAAAFEMQLERLCETAAKREEFNIKAELEMFEVDLAKKRIMDGIFLK